MTASREVYGRLTDLARLDDPRDGSRWYLDPDNQEIRYQSVTWTCSASESAPWLTGWSGRVTAEWVIDNLETVLAFLYDPEYGPGAAVEIIRVEAERQRALAADVGVWLHDVLEALALDQPIPDPPPDMLGRRLDGVQITQGVLDAWAHGLLCFLEDYSPEVILSEATVANPVEGYAGTLDLGAIIGGLTWLLDLKSGKNLPRWLEVQLAMYRHAPEVWLPLGIRAEPPAWDRCGVLHLRPSYHRGYKLREIDTGPEVVAEYRRRIESLRWREQRPVRPVFYPPGPDGEQPFPLVEDLPLRTRRSLLTAGLVSLDELAEFTARDLGKVRGVGRESVAQIVELLAAHGLSLADDVEGA